MKKVVIRYFYPPIVIKLAFDTFSDNQCQNIFAILWNYSKTHKCGDVETGPFLSITFHTCQTRIYPQRGDCRAPLGRK